MRGIKWFIIIALSLALHAGLAMAWIFNQPSIAPQAAPMTIAMIAFESEEPAAEPAPAVVEPEPEPEPQVEPEPEPVPVVEPAIVLPEKKPEVKKKPKPKKEEKREVKPVETKIAKTEVKPLSDMNKGATAPKTAKTNTLGETNPQANRGPKALRKQAPSYPDRARRLGKDGYVKVRFDVDNEGRVVNVEFLAASPKGLFEREVKRAMNRWAYEAKPGKGYITEIHFKIDGSVSQS
nr:TonB family protein [uncultured Moellerella sp.]